MGLFCNEAALLEEINTVMQLITELTNLSGWMVKKKLWFGIPLF